MQSIARYFALGSRLSAMVSLIILVLVWTWFTLHVGVFGFMFGWFPAALVAALSWLMLVVFWGPILLFCILLSLAMVAVHYRPSHPALQGGSAPTRIAPVPAPQASPAPPSAQSAPPVTIVPPPPPVTAAPPIVTPVTPAPPAPPLVAPSSPALEFHHAPHLEHRRLVRPVEPPPRPVRRRHLVPPAYAEPEPREPVWRAPALVRPQPPRPAPPVAHGENLDEDTAATGDTSSRYGGR